ncbi:MAG: hypothetical protein KIT87_13315 [Anaerolineae bacterium]|nr:hypothetical protein [Anaerolineae bacterium]
MADYKARLEKMIQDLGKYSWVEIVEHQLNPAASDKDLKRVEDLLGAPLAKPIRDFYSQVNGLKFRWRIKLDVSEDKAKELRKISQDYQIEIAESDSDPMVMINFIPITESMIKRDWHELIDPQQGETVEFAGDKYSYEEFRPRLKPFDLFSLYSCAAFLIEQGNGDPKVLILDNHYYEWDNTRITDFDTYLEAVLTTYGLVEARERIFSAARGDLKPPLILTPDKIRQKYGPKLFKREGRE